MSNAAGYPKAPSALRFAGALHDAFGWHECVARAGRDLGLRWQSAAATPLFGCGMVGEGRELPESADATAFG
jgi:hypothetical protein